MRYVCRLYYLSVYWYTYGMRIIIKSDNDWYEVIGYVHKKQYIIIYIPVPMTYVRRCYYVSTYWYIYRMRTTI